MADCAGYTPLTILDDEDDEDDNTDDLKMECHSPKLSRINEDEETKDNETVIITINDAMYESMAPLSPLAGNMNIINFDTKTFEPKKLKKQGTIRCNEPDLNMEECELLEKQIDILLEKDFQISILNELYELYPKLKHSFSMVSGSEKQADFVCRMMRKGYIYVYNNKYDQLYNIFTRHQKYGIYREHVVSLLDIIIKNVLTDKSITNISKSKEIWTKSNDILTDIMGKAYKFNHGTNRLKKKPSQKTLKKNRNRIARSMSDEDIECVLMIWQRMIINNKDKVGMLLAKKLQTENEIYAQFRRFNIDIFKQSTVIINMLDKTINELSNTDRLIPFLQKLGGKHYKMGIKPQLLALMKRIILELIREILSFNYNKSIKESWNRVLTFIVGLMMMEYSNSRLHRGSTYSTTQSTSFENDWLSHKPTLNDYDSNDIELLEDHLSQTVILNCQTTWKYIDNEPLINNAVKIFYQDLIKSKDEIRELFSKSNMAEQSKRLVRAIGSTVSLLDDLETLIPVLQELGKRHVYYGVKPEHFKYVRKCWFKMLKKALNLQWNTQISSSWQIAWDFMTFHMKSSLEDALLLYVPPEPVYVNFKVLINHIDRVKLSELSFFGDIWYAAYTGDNSSQSYAFGYGHHKTHKTGKQQDDTLPFGGVKCLNSMQISDKYRSSKEPYIRYFDDDDSWYLRGNIVGTFSQLFELHAYPFDVHYIEIIFALEVDDTIAKFNENKISVRLMPFKLDAMAGTNFNVYDPKIQLLERSAIEGGSTSGRNYTHCRITIPISRKYIHHVYNIIIPLIAIQLIAFAIYFTDLFPITARLILSMTLFLTLFAFRRSTSGSLPPTPYLTVLDHAFNGACLLSVYHVAGLCEINQFQHLSNHTLKLVNIIIGATGLAIFAIVNTYLFIKAKHYISLYPKRKQFIKGNVALAQIAKSALGKSAMSLTDY